MRTSVTIQTDITTFGKKKLPNIYILRKICKGFVKEYNITPERLIAAVEVCPRCHNEQKTMKKPIRRNDETAIVKVNCESCRGFGFIINPSRF
jgi:hypothetical protein